MYIISALLEKERSRVALYNEEYQKLSQKDGTRADLFGLYMDTVNENSISPADVDYIGIAVDGVCEDPDVLVADIEKKSGIRCMISSLIGAKALGKAYLTNDVPTLFWLNVNDTVESGIVIDKKLYFGMHQLEGSVAHMVVHFDGYQCACGRRGCFEAYASNEGMRRIAAEAGVENAEALTLQALFDMDTPNAELAKKLYVKYLAGGITNIVTLFQPNELILEGPFTEIGDKLLSPVTDIVLREQYSHSMENKCNVRLASKEADTALLGAALLGRWSGV